MEEQRFDTTVTGRAEVATITELTPKRDGALGATADALTAQSALDTSHNGLLDAETFASIYHPGKLLLLAFWVDAEAAGPWIPLRPDGAKSLRHRQVRIIRDYGMFDRREAPQYYRKGSHGMAAH